MCTGITSGAGFGNYAGWRHRMTPRETIRAELARQGVSQSEGATAIVAAESAIAAAEGKVES